MSNKIADSDQRARFIEAARELCADEDETTVKAKLMVFERQKPEDEPGNGETEETSLGRP